MIKKGGSNFALSNDVIKLLHYGGEYFSQHCVGKELEKIGIAYILYYACDIPARNGVIDVIMSYSTLEYIPLRLLEKLFYEFKRIAKSDAIIIHFINLLDHYSDSDKRIPKFNFYKYEHDIWERFYNNSIHYHNRLRNFRLSKVAQKVWLQVIR